MAIYINGIGDFYNEQHLHEVINRCDVSKDGRIKPDINKVPVFLNVANKLFPAKLPGNRENIGSKTILGLIEMAIMKPEFRGLGTVEAIPCPRSDTTTNFLGREYVYGVQDSGYSFTDINPIMTTQILTPGSYIDPAKRQPKGILFPYNETLLGNDGNNIMQKIGFGDLNIKTNFDSKQLKDNIGEATTYMKSNMEISKTFNNNIYNIDSIRNYYQNMHSITKNGKNINIDYFGGNKEKNKAIQNFNEKNTEDVFWYILCKLLGDTLQVVYIYLLFELLKEEFNNTNTCIFTCDNVVEIRCRLLGIPCCKQMKSEDDDADEEDYDEKSKYFRNVNFSRPIQDPVTVTLSKINIFKEDCISNNNKVINTIRVILLDKVFIIGTDETPVNQAIIIYLNNIIESIEKTNDYIRIMIPDRDQGESNEQLLKRILEINKNNITISGADDPNNYNNLLIAVKDMTTYLQASMLFASTGSNKKKVKLLKVNRQVISLFKKESDKYSYVDEISSSVIKATNDVILENRSKGKLFVEQLQRIKGEKDFTGYKGGGLEDITQEERNNIINEYNTTTIFKSKINKDLNYIIIDAISPIDNDTYFEFFYFLIPYFNYLGETCFEIDKLKYIYDNFFIKQYDDNNNEKYFSDFISWYVKEVMNKREMNQVSIGFNGYPEPVIYTDQRIYLKRFGITPYEELEQLFIKNATNILESEYNEYSRIMAIRLAEEPSLPTPPSQISEPISAQYLPLPPVPSSNYNKRKADDFGVVGLPPSVRVRVIGGKNRKTRKITNKQHKQTIQNKRKSKNNKKNNKGTRKHKS